MTKNGKNDVTAGSYKRGCHRKYNCTLEERMKRVPKGNTIRGIWTDARGESCYIPLDKSIKAILHIFGLDGIFYREGIPDFSVCAKVTVKIKNMSGIRRENFRQCDVRCAEEWGLKKYEGKDKWTSSDVKQWRKENGYTWHERNDMVTCDLVPTKINKFFGHLGGVSECKKCRMVKNACFA